ncbi:GTP 3',8-cyclase MoaA [Enhygromyxa salina]|uniref:GTP 3',8-cyclase n=1 Tax=Enhygromyxa salina TaxID=215803 RepID=A0A2S9YIK0_9BACT|nr:GTP 3',8-cyclase MoaA [Enhygromyxa salina]PRQ04937.1 Cyclic pyranopterin monophosphate synthase [Enhygromyxa salina]
MRLVQLRKPAAVLAAGQSVGAGDDGPVLVDRLERRVRYLRVSLTDRCSMRCTYCMPPEGIEHVDRSEVLSLEEVARMVAAFAAWGVERVRLTGGEPTLRRNLTWLVQRLTQLRTPSGAPLRVVMTSNGELIERLAGPLKAAGLETLTISLDSLDRERFAAITRRDKLDQVVAGFAAAHAVGLPLKLNTVAVRGFNDDELGALCRFAWQHDATPRFIELMPMAGGRLFVPGELMPAAEIRERVGAELGAVVELADQPQGPFGPAQYYVLRGGAHDGRRFGTIAAMTENFCGSCNRLRVSATGQLHACLARDDAGDLRGALRSAQGEAGAAALERVVRTALGHKRDAHGFEQTGEGGPRKAMISIGG